MSLGNPNNLIIVVLLGVAGIMFVMASLIGGKKWRRLYAEERDEYASYAEGADGELRAARERIAELEREYAALQQQHSDALASIASLKSEAAARVTPEIPAPAAAVEEAQPIAVEPVAAAAPLMLVPAAEQADAEPAALLAAEPAPAPVDVPIAEPEAPAAEHRPIAPEWVAEANQARPITPFGLSMTELPPAPIHGVTPLRAAEPPQPEIVPPPPPVEEPVAEVTPPPSEAAASEPVHAEPEPPAETAHGDTPEHPAKATPFATMAHIAEGAALAEVAHLAWNAYSAHKHHAEAEHAAGHVETPAEETPHDAAPEHPADAPAAAPTAPVAETADVAPAVEPPAKSWFGAAKRDDLTRLRGIDETINTRLLGLGVTSFDDIVHLSQEDEMALEPRLDLPAGYITREQWRDQASLLRLGKDDEFNERFGA